MTTPRFDATKPPSPDIFDAIDADIKVSQRCALRQHSCKKRCPACSDLIAVL